MKISIITPSFNQGKYIEQNILSVLNQNYTNFEHIIIDGGSTDNTLEILRKYPHLKWISEPDEGQADALNKGLKLATGEIIGWINSDDYYENDIFYTVINEFKDNDVKWLCGNILFKYEELNIFIPDKTPLITYNALIKNPDIVRQQAAFYRKDILISIGGFNKSYYMVMDYDLWIKLSKMTNPKMVDKVFAIFRIHDEQKSTEKNIKKQIIEINEILRNENVSFIRRFLIGLKKQFYYLKLKIKKYLISIGIFNKKYSYISFSKRKFLKG